MRIHRYPITAGKKSSTMSLPQFRAMVEDAFDDNQDVNSTEDVTAVDDVMLEDEAIEDFDNGEDYSKMVRDDVFYPDSETDSDEAMYSNYEDFIDSVNDTFEDPLDAETIEEDIENLQIALNNIAEENGEEVAAVIDCPIYWNDSYVYPIIEINGIRYNIHYIDETDEPKHIELHLVEDDTYENADTEVIDETCHIEANAYVDDEEAAVQYLIDNTPLPRDAAQFAVEWVLDGEDLDGVKKFAPYLMWYSSEDWATDAQDDYDADSSIFEDTAFDGVIVVEQAPRY